MMSLPISPLPQHYYTGDPAEHGCGRSRKTLGLTPTLPGESPCPQVLEDGATSRRRSRGPVNDATVVLKNSLSIPKLLYLLGTIWCELDDNPLLSQFDDALRRSYIMSSPQQRSTDSSLTTFQILGMEYVVLRCWLSQSSVQRSNELRYCQLRCQSG